MNTHKFYLLFALFLMINALPIEAQVIERQLLFWENRTIDIGTVFEENGKIEVEFLGLNQSDSLILISDVITDCGCTTVEFSQDTIFQSKVGSVKISYEPDHRGGPFTKLIVVRTNQDIYGDTLYLQGNNIPLPDDLMAAYAHQVKNVGFRLPAINMGNVYTNEAKIKLVEIYNFGVDSLRLMSNASSSDFIDLSLFPEVIGPDQRGLIEIAYNGADRADFGFVSDDLILNFEGMDEPVSIKLLANIFEYFEPIPKSMMQNVPRLGIQDVEIDLKDIRANQIVKRKVKLTNQGGEPLQIRKVVGNCDCVLINLESLLIQPNESTDLEFTFDPKGRRGIDHKHITIFSNDPVNPVRTIIVKSTIK
ncbi:DUF1573 domain-containing protein [Belliella pelovolcani]|nr:DUF1573 domain-containing protein [Belliella pelovolcani]